MRSRLITFLIMAVVGTAISGCAVLGPKPAPTPSPAAVVALRPTFTPTVTIPTATKPAPTAAPSTAPTKAPAAAPTATQVPPTPTSQPAMLTVADPTVNVRSGPSTNYPQVGTVQQGQQFQVLAKNSAGDWWQFNFNNSPAWVSGRFVTVNGSASNAPVAEPPAAPVVVAPAPVVVAPAPAAPAPSPQPTAVPAPPKPTYTFGLRETTGRDTSNAIITVYCQVINGQDAFIDGSFRVSGPAGTQTKAFSGRRADGGSGSVESKFWYNQDCKIEFVPPVDGAYTAIILQGDTQIGDPVTFNVAGATREFIIAWRQK
jgi:uncharacterized protein YraI